MSAARLKPACAARDRSGQSEGSRLAAAQRRDRNARASQTVLLRQARKHARLPEDAEEALQAACILFIERYEEHYRPLPWLQTTVKREAWRIARRAHCRRELAITAVPRQDGSGTTDLTDAFPDLDADPFENACRHELTREHRAALDTLKPDQRTALLLLGLGCSYAEICRLRAWTHTKVNRSLSEGRAALRERLGSHENG